MATILETLAKMLRNEAGMGYQDQCVQGGFKNFSSAWIGNARKEPVPEVLVLRVEEWLTRYHEMGREQREQTLQDLLHEVETAPHMETPGANLPASLGEKSHPPHSSNPAQRNPVPTRLPPYPKPQRLEEPLRPFTRIRPLRFPPKRGCLPLFSRRNHPP